MSICKFLKQKEETNPELPPEFSQLKDVSKENSESRYKRYVSNSSITPHQIMKVSIKIEDWHKSVHEKEGTKIVLYRLELLKNEEEFFEREQSPSSFSDSESEDTTSAGSFKKEGETTTEIKKLKKLTQSKTLPKPTQCQTTKAPLRSSTTGFFKSNSTVNKLSPAYQNRM